MKKFIKVIGMVAILGSVATASTTTITTEVSKNQVEDITTVHLCDAIMRILGMCRSTETLPQD